MTRPPSQPRVTRYSTVRLYSTPWVDCAPSSLRLESAMTLTDPLTAARDTFVSAAAELLAELRDDPALCEVWAALPSGCRFGFEITVEPTLAMRLALIVVSSDGVRYELGEIVAVL